MHMWYAFLLIPLAHEFHFNAVNTYINWMLLSCLELFSGL